jgi:2-oxoglutarate ferredoxin oxidoreductase subunit alpha
MGVPVSPRNIFPSNIQGLPTWYEVRVSEPGWLGRRGGVDLMVAMNPQTWDKDVAEVEPGGYLFYDSTKPLPKDKFRDDIHVVGMPLMEICNARTRTRASASSSRTSSTWARSRRCSTSSWPRSRSLIAEQYKGKEKLLEPNIKALHMGAITRSPTCRRSA